MAAATKQSWGSLRSFFQDEAGAIYGSTSYVTTTVAVSVPLGLMFYSIYDALCTAGRYTNFMLGLF